jgi:hypothetical protein
MIGWIRRLFRKREPPARAVHMFQKSEPLLTEEGVTVELIDGWRIESAEARVVLLFAVDQPDVRDCQLIFRAQMKAWNLEKGGYLAMECAGPWGRVYAKGTKDRIRGTGGWARYEICAALGKKARPDCVTLSFVFDGPGVVWLKDVELLYVPHGEA